MKLIKNTIYNLAGLGLPLLVAVFCIPILIRELGDARFGLLTLIWAVVSYFGLFDLGLGRALTQSLAITFAEDKNERVAPLITTTVVLMAFLGCGAAFLVVALAPFGIRFIQDIPNKQEAVSAMNAMALAMPAIVLTSGFRGVLEARHAFGIVNMIRLPMGIFTFGGPLAVVIYGSSRLDDIAYVLAMGRWIACFIHLWFAWKQLPNNARNFKFRRSLLMPLLTSGGWLTISNIVSPLMSYADRFIVGGLVSAAAVAYYTTPQEIVTKLSIIPGALTAVLFPTFSAQIARKKEESLIIFWTALRWLAVITLPLTLVIALFSEELLRVWIGVDFSAESFRILQILSFGVFVSCLAQIPFTFLQSAGHARRTALIHTVEFPIFILMLFWLTTVYGAMGAAVAWTLRVSGDALIMYIYSMKLFSTNHVEVIKSVLKVVVPAGLGFFGVLLDSPWYRLGWFVIFIIGLFFVVLKEHLPKVKGSV